MRQNFSFIYKLLLLAGDAFALLLAFTLAYILRVHLDTRPIITPVKSLTYITLVATLLPIWLGVFALLGLYAKRTFERRPREAGRLLLAAISGVLLLVTYDFFSTEVLFPAKSIPVYAAIISFLLLLIMRSLLRRLRLYLYTHEYGVVRIILVGNGETTYFLSKYLHNNPYSGYKIVGIVANKSHVYEKFSDKQYRSLLTAIEKTKPHAVIQTDGEDVTKIYNQAVAHHLDYQFIPTHAALFAARHSVDLLGTFPIINVHTTPLVGYGRAIKRIIDVVLSSLGIIVLSPLFLIIAVLQKLTDPRGPIFFKQERLTRFGAVFNIYKFRSLKTKYNGKDALDVFQQMGREDLVKEYTENRSKVAHDPRISTVGRFLRRTSLDELPQLVNILKGDISLVGPRAIPKSELIGYEKVAPLVLSVKSGLTGLAQISGRSEITMQERLNLDVYYVQHWSIAMDVQIILRTILSLLTGRGAV